ncbi:MAG: helix-turn-helix domain-containing protein [Bacillota bacterium]|nr:helix-turn-helix domain-containing protein [Bacillota bacterium]
MTALAISPTRGELLRLAQRVVEGDGSALEPLLRAFERPIRRAAWRNGRVDPEVADALRAELAIVLLGVVRRGLPRPAGPRGSRRPCGRGT